MDELRAELVFLDMLSNVATLEYTDLTRLTTFSKIDKIHRQINGKPKTGIFGLPKVPIPVIFRQIRDDHNTRRPRLTPERRSKHQKP